MSTNVVDGFFFLPLESATRTEADSGAEVANSISLPEAIMSKATSIGLKLIG
jgi:hypothetical protein